MTTPNQPAPDGSVTVGGGQFNYGQLIDENTFKADFLFEPPTDLAGALDLLPVVLSKLPNDAFRPWQKWLRLPDSALTGGEVQGELNLSLDISPFRTLMDDITNTFFGGTSYELTSNTDVLAALNKAYQTLQEQAKAWFAFSIQNDGTAAAKEAFTVDFNNVTSVEAAGFEVTYSGAGQSALEVVDGVAQWRVADRLPRTAMVVYESDTATSYQSVRGTLSAPPEPGTGNGDPPAFWALARVSPDRRNYVWARGYSQGLGVYKADVGCTVDGLDTVWATDIPLTWNFNMRWEAGIGTNPREYQLWSGNKVVYTHTEVGFKSRLCDGDHATEADHTETCVKFHGWGAVAELRDGRSGGRVDAAGVIDNTPTAVTGSTARLARVSDTPVESVGGDAVTQFPASFFDDVVYESGGVNAIPSTGVMSLSRANTYVVTARVHHAVGIAAPCDLLLQGSEDGATWTTLQYGASTAPAAGEALVATWIQPMPAGSALRLAYKHPGLTIPGAMTGGSAGAKTYFSVAGVGVA